MPPSPPKDGALGGPTSWRPSARLSASERYGRFEILGRIARGGMAEILLARERSSAFGTRHLVIKRVLPEIVGIDEISSMFLDEARLVMGLSHPNLCQIHEVGEQDGSCFIAMEWVNGVTLHELTRRACASGGIDHLVVTRIAAQCAEALHHAHTARDADGRPMRLVHRDVSPHNVMVAYDGRVKLLDFGIAKSIATSHVTDAGVVKGKLCYMAPEQWLGRTIDARTDVFALGATLYEALSGRVLFRRDSQLAIMNAAVGGDVPSLSELAPRVPRALSAIVHRALATDPDERFATARGMSEALEQFLAASGEPVGAGRVAAHVRKLFRSEVGRGPALEPVRRAGDLEAGVRLPLPPLPPALLSATYAPDNQQSISRTIGTRRSRSRASLAAALPPIGLDVEDELDDPLDDEPTRARFPYRSSLHGTTAIAERLPSAMPRARRSVRPRPAAGTISMRVGPRMRRLGLAALLAVAVPLAFATHVALTRTPTPLVKQLNLEERPRVASGLPFEVLARSSPHAARPEPRASTERPSRKQRVARLTLRTEPRALVYLGKERLGRTPLVRVRVPRGPLVLRLVEDGGRVHVRRVPAISPGREHKLKLKL